MRDFPHLADTRFPNFDTTHPYQFKNTFDYTRWIPETRIHLCNVLWDSDYENVVKFEDNDARDSWFDSIDEHVEVLTSDMRVVPDGYVKMPIPYDVMARYNYLWIELPFATSEDMPLDYETDGGVTRWYFFINGTRYMAPNTTEVTLSLDVWTTHVNDMEFKYCMLERGHAPVNAVTTDEFLLDPIWNTRYLLAEDVNFGEADITQFSDMIEFGNGEKFLVIFTTVSMQELSLLGTVTSSSEYDYGNITFSDVEARNGYQLQVNGYTFGNGRDYTNQRTVVTQGGNSSDYHNPNNLFAFAIAADSVYGSRHFLTDCVATCPAFLNTVKGMCMVDRSMINFGTQFSFLGYTMFVAREGGGIHDGIRLTKDMFDFQPEFERFAKLYTFPYSVLELSDNDGHTVEVKVENTSRSSMLKTDVSFAFPYLNLRVLFTGIDGVGAVKYDWYDIRNSVEEMELPIGDWRKVCFDFDIPTYAFYMDGETMYYLDDFHRGVKQAKRQALVAYHSGARDANTAYENALDANAASYDNAKNTADCVDINTGNSVAEFIANNDTVANVLYDNSLNSRRLAEWNVNLSTAQRYAALRQSLDSSTDALQLNILHNDDTVDVNNGLSLSTVNTQNQSAISTTITSSIANIASGTIQGAYNGMMSGVGTGASIGGQLGDLGLLDDIGIPTKTVGTALGGLVGGALGASAGGTVGFVTTGIDSVASVTNAAIVAGANSSVTNATIVANEQKALLDDNFAYDQQRLNNYAKETTDEQARDAEKAAGSMDRAVNLQNTNNTVAQMRNNRRNTSDAMQANQTNTRRLSDGIAQRNFDMLNSNSNYTHLNGFDNLKERILASRDWDVAGALDARNATPRQIGDYNGDFSQDAYRCRGVQIRVKTQSDSAIRQTADQFARYGYMLNQQWDLGESGFNIMGHFTYWKMADVWVNDLIASNASNERAIKGILTSGVTVWNNPNEIGRVNIYDN